MTYETRHAPLAASGGIKATLASRRELSVADTSVAGVRSTLQYQPPFGSNTSLGALLIDGYIQSWPAFLALDASLTCADKP